jgi:AraC family transcriptional regulator of adaptative response/methylated-DNA-[protein]-cysteine methyltransferase
MGRTAKPPSHKSRQAASDDVKWAAIVAHDGAYDGRFYYSVDTTGIYCRPSCPSRRPNRANVRFHKTATDAEHAGFRACKRCKPNQSSLHQEHTAKVAQACQLIEQSEDAPKLGELAEAVGLSPYHFHRIFKSVAGLTPKAYATAHRHKRVRDKLSEGATVTKAIYDAGYNSNGRFYATASDVLGMAPGKFRAGGVDTAIRFAIGACSLGSVLVAASDKGVCAILLGDDPEALLHDLEERFPRAELIGGDAAFEQLAARVIGFVEAPQTGLDLPLDARGTAFQHRVWQALRDIPAGSTASYTEIARRIGSPKSVRAVASACAANPLAVAIPCHRVVRKDGDLSGYRWGVERKRILLDREAG